MKIQTGRGTIPLITLLAIWSISALTSLPGLAVSPPTNLKKSRKLASSKFNKEYSQFKKQRI